MALFLEFSLLRRMIETKHKENLMNHQVFLISKDGINEGTKHQQYCHLAVLHCIQQLCFLVLVYFCDVLTVLFELTELEFSSI